MPRAYDLRRRQERDERWADVQKKWANGATESQLAKEMGWSTKQVSVQLHRMRKAGLHVPYRRGDQHPEKVRHGRPKGR